MTCKRCSRLGKMYLTGEYRKSKIEGTKGDRFSEVNCEQ